MGLCVAVYNVQRTTVLVFRVQVGGFVQELSRLILELF